MNAKADFLILCAAVLVRKTDLKTRTLSLLLLFDQIKWVNRIAIAGAKSNEVFQ